MAVSKSLWDSDEALFCSALRGFDVTQHHPHPPGFPLYILAAHVTRFFTASDFRALQTVTVIAAMLLFAVAFAFGRSIGMSFAETLSGSLILVFLPNVWFYGGTAFSDISALAALLAAAAALLFSISGDRRLYLAGSLLLGVAIAFRPQNALIGMAPWISASWPRLRERRRLEVLAGAAAVIFVAVAAYGGAALESRSVAGYIEAVKIHENYVKVVDSYRNPVRPPFAEVLWRFVINPFDAKKLSIVLWSLAVIGALSLRRSAIAVILTFLPFLVFAWIMLDVLGASRLSTGFIPMPAFLAALGISFVARSVSFGDRALRSGVQAVMSLSIVAYMIWWTLPALQEAGKTDSPPVQACSWLAQHVPASGTQIYVDRRMSPFTRYVLGNHRQTDVDDTFTGTEVADPAHSWFIGEGSNVFQEAINFRRPRGRLWNIVRHRYFEISVRPITSSVSFGRGWYDEESTGGDVWRWMGPRSETRLSAVPGPARLHFDFHFPSDGKQSFPVVTISLNGQIVDRFRPADSAVEKTYTVAGRGNAPNDLVIETDGVVNLSRAGIAHDARDLGLELLGLSWRPLP
jgi:MFS family permease